jgi:hypothetical protein
VHAGAFEASADGHLAAGLDDSGRGAQALGVEVGVAHAVTVGLEVGQSPASVLAGGSRAADSSQQSVESARVEFLVSPLGPCRGARVGGPLESLGEVAEMLFGGEAIDDLPGLGKQFGGEVPNPGGAITPDHGALHGRETAARGFAPDPLAELRALRGGGGEAALSMAAE